MIVIFVTLSLLSHFDFLPDISDFFNKLNISEHFALPKPLCFLIYLPPSVIVFFIVYFVLAKKRDYSLQIKDTVKRTKDDVISEYYKNLEIISKDQLVIQLDQRKKLLIEELKQKYGHDSINTEIIESTTEIEWKEIERILFVNQKPEENLVSTKSIENNVDVPEANSTESENEESDFIEELEEPEVINPLEVIDELEELDVSNNEITKDFDILEELQNADDNLEELEEPNSVEDVKESKEIENNFGELELADDSIDNIEQIDEIEELDDIEELDEVEYKDPYPELIPSQNEKTVYTADNNTTFISVADEGFASVDNIFAEDLCIGTEYFHTYDSFDDGFKFMPVKLEFFLDKNIDEPLPIDEGNCFSLTRFNDKQPDFVELEEEYSSAIIEVEGVFSISDNLSYENVLQDQDFKNLVNSVLH